MKRALKRDSAQGKLYYKFNVVKAAALDKIGGYSSGKKGQHGNEQEVVIPPQSYFEVKRIIRDAEVNGKTHKLFVELDQIR